VDLLLPILGFLCVSLVVCTAGLRLGYRRADAIDRRLQEVTGARPHREGRERGHLRGTVALLKHVGEKIPRSPKELGSVRLRLVQAGYRREEALPVFYGLRMLVATSCFFLFATPIFVRPNLTFGLIMAAIGYVLPAMILARMVKKRQHRIRLSLADALDLLVVSVEAGLGLDQALLRVSQELDFAYPEFSTELKLINLELRAGKSRSEALRNLGDRTGVEDVSALATMLIQTDKFGTSVAQSLRVHSETLRTKRRQRAEEAAAKTGVKMVFPLVLCIFPAIWIVTIGPAAIQFMQVLIPTVQGGGP